MRIENWNPNVADQTFENVSMKRLVDAAEVIAEAARRNCKVKTGALKKSVRVVRKRTKSGKAFSRKRNIRIYAGSYEAYYAAWVEFGTSKTPMAAYMRPAQSSTLSEVKAIIGVR